MIINIETLSYLIHWQNHIQRDQQSHQELFTLSTVYTSLVRRTYAQAVYRPRKDTLFRTKINKIDTLFKTKIPKNVPWLVARPH